MARWLTTLLSAAVLLGAAGTGAGAVEPDAPDRLIDKEFVTLIAVRDGLDGERAKKLAGSGPELKGLSDYYKADDAKLLWIGERGLKAKATRSLRTAFARADMFGLDPRDYSLANSEAVAAEPNASPTSLADAELRISLTALSYANHAQAGRVMPTSIDSEFLDLKPKRPAARQVLAGLAKSGDDLAGYLESFHPPHPQFKALKQKLAEVRSAVTTGSIPVRIPEGPSLGPDTYHPQIAIVRERLSVPVPQDAPRGNAAQYYDAALAEAVRAFQETKGLRPDGIIGRNTREALNEGTIAVSVNTILSNMERWRWAPRELGERYVFINIPEFKFFIVDHGRVIHEERIVTGSPKHPTPVFSDEIETLVLNPYWHVPQSIIANEIIPAARNNPDYLYRNNLEVFWLGDRQVEPYMVDWQFVNPAKLSLRQTPGPGNALGRIKFLFPNKHSVYMHDTPSKHLFDKPVRAYSHGCMRVRNPLEFAKLLLADQGWSEARIRDTLEIASDQHVRLEKKVPVHISYFTAWVDDDGTLKGFWDIYGHDASVRVALKLDSREVVASTEENFDVGEGGLQN
jgi:murein L,D-transpeptidase YcbB/YkuD